MNSEEFIALAPERQRAYVDPTTAGYFTRIYYSDGDLKAVVTHWPSKVEVSEVSMTTSLATCFGMFASLMRASISEEDLTLLVAEFPDYMWLTIKDLTMQAQEWLKNASNEEWCDILDRMSHYLESENAKEKFDKLINEDPYNFQRLLEADGKLIEGDKQPSESTFWLFYWAALYAAWATSQHKLPPWSPNFIDGKPHKQAMSDQSLRASITTTLRSLKPGTPQPK